MEAVSDPVPSGRRCTAAVDADEAEARVGFQPVGSTVAVGVGTRRLGVTIALAFACAFWMNRRSSGPTPPSSPPSMSKLRGSPTGSTVSTPMIARSNAAVEPNALATLKIAVV